MFRNDEIEYTTSDDGRKIAVLEMGSQILPMLSIDTYQLFSGDSYCEGEHYYLTEEVGLPDGVVEVNVGDFRRLLHNLAVTSHDWVSTRLLEVDSPAVVTHGDVIDTWSPQFYNFHTDQYDAKYAIDLERMEEWIAARQWDHHEYGNEHFASRSGFVSFVPGYLRNPDMSEGVRLWLFVHAYMSEVFELDHEHPWHYRAEDDWKMHMWEAEDEIYMDACVTEWCKVGLSFAVNERLENESQHVGWRDVETPDFEPWEPEIGEGEQLFNEWLDDYVSRLQAV